MNNREIEFRGKNEDGKWSFGDLRRTKHFNGVSHNTIFTISGQDHSSNLSVVIPGTVGQYTGLKDKNDVKIYEGDIVYFSIFDHNDNDTQFTGVVKYVDGMFEVWHDDKCEYYGNDGAFILGFVAEQDEEMSIIGNIHDNPELLEGI